MGKKRRTVLALIVLFALAGGLWLLFGTRGPVYHGKSLTRWVDDCSAEVRTNRFAPGYYFLYTMQNPRVVRHFGPSAVPPLIRMLEAKHSVEQRIYDLLRSKKLQYKWATNYIDKLSLDLLRPRTAAYFLGCLGPDAEPAIPALMRAAVDTNDVLSRNAIDALGAIHQRPEVVIPFLIGLATGTNSQMSLEVLSPLAEYTNQPKMVLPTLIHALDHPLAYELGDANFTIVALAARALRHQRDRGRSGFASGGHQCHPGTSDAVLGRGRLASNRAGCFG